MGLELKNKDIEAEKEALKGCENEVIHDIGLIQPFGYLIAIDKNSQVITEISENCADGFNKPIDELLGISLEDLFSREIVHQCNNAFAHSTISTQREHVGRTSLKGSSYDVFAHLKQNHFILELQSANQESLAGIRMLDHVQRILERIGSNTTSKELLNQAVEELHAISGFNRVKAYQFLSDGAGEIVAESKDPQVDSFLGLRFPSFDIPQAARELYATTPIRIIPSVTAEQVKIKTKNASKSSLDLSLSLLRGVVPVHVMYLQNMGVKATLSLPIVINGKMWGLFAFHHMEEKMLDSEVLSALEILGGSISMLLNTILQQHRIENIKESTRVASSLFVPDESALGFSSYWGTASSELATLITCDGLALLSKDRLDSYGNCPSETGIRELAKKLDKEFRNNLSTLKPIAIDSIISKYPELDFGNIAGVLAIIDPAKSYDYLLYFRKGASHNVRWAGKPTKDISKSEGNFRLNPRGSFAEYIDSKQQQSDSFSQEDIVVAETLKDSLSRTMSTVAIQTQHRERLGLVIRELNHRVRNTLALVASIISQSRENAHDIEKFIHSLEQRLQALSETQKLLTEFEWHPVNIQTLFERALIPYRDLINRRITFHGKKVSLASDLASLFALIINELASNALKYGALSNSTGEIKIKWEHTAENLIINWKETGGPEVEEPTRNGFGSSLITEAIPYEFSGNCSLNFPPDGVEASFIIPINNIEVEAEDGELETIALPIEPKAFVALVLEDDFIIAKEMTKMLKSLGASKVDAAPTLERAASYIETNVYDIAILDANIHGKFSGEIAELIRQKNVPFAFATGYGSADQELAKIPCLDILTKPVSKIQLLNILKLAKLESN